MKRQAASGSAEQFGLIYGQSSSLGGVFFFLDILEGVVHLRYVQKVLLMLTSEINTLHVVQAVEGGASDDSGGITASEGSNVGGYGLTQR